MYTEMARGDPYNPVTPRLQMLVEYNALHLPCPPWSNDNRGEYLTHLIKRTEQCHMRSKPLKPLIVMGDFKIANFEVLYDKVLLRTAVNVNQLNGSSMMNIQIHVTSGHQTVAPTRNS